MNGFLLSGAAMEESLNIDEWPATSTSETIFHIKNTLLLYLTIIDHYSIPWAILASPYTCHSISLSLFFIYLFIY